VPVPVPVVGAPADPRGSASTVPVQPEIGRLTRVGLIVAYADRLRVQSEGVRDEVIEAGAPRRR
jgi:hypothetical protein